jgi:hypothetical protein
LRASDLATRMTKPSAAATCAAILLEGAARDGEVPSRAMKSGVEG